MAHTSEVGPVAEGVVGFRIEIDRDPDGLRTISPLLVSCARAAAAASTRSARHVICNSCDAEARSAVRVLPWHHSTY